MCSTRVVSRCVALRELRLWKERNKQDALSQLRLAMHLSSLHIKGPYRKSEAMYQTVLWLGGREGFPLPWRLSMTTLYFIWANLENRSDWMLFNCFGVFVHFPELSWHERRQTRTWSSVLCMKRFQQGKLLTAGLVDNEWKKGGDGAILRIAGAASIFYLLFSTLRTFNTVFS